MIPTKSNKPFYDTTRSITQPTTTYASKNPTPSHSSTPQPPSPSCQSFSIGDRVQCSNSMVGICRFIGTIHSKIGIWVGVDLSSQKNQPPNPWHGKGKNSGAVDGVVYFECPPLCGIFFPLSKVSLLANESSASTSLKAPQAQVNQQSTKPSAALNHTLSSHSHGPHFQSDHHANKTISSLPCISPASCPSNSPSLPEACDPPTPMYSNPNQPLITHSSANVIPANKQLMRKPSTIKLSKASSGSLTSPCNPLSPQNNHPSNLQDLSSAKILQNSLSKSTHQIKRSSASQLSYHPPSKPPEKRSESVNSHYSQTDRPDWARASHGQRPKSRLSLVSTSEPRHQQDQPQPSQLHRNGLPQQPILHTNNAVLQDKVTLLEKQVQQSQFQMLELEQQHLIKCSELELEIQRSKESLKQHEEERLVELEKTKQELAQQSQAELNSLREEISKLKESLQINQQTLSEQTSKFGQERTELQNQLQQLRLAGQSLCGVYENKISNLEEIRLSQLHESELISQELKATKLALEELQQKAQSNPTDGAVNVVTSVNSAREAIEIDNERLRADLKHTKERLSEVQDEAYRLKQELENEREVLEQQNRFHEQALEQHLLSLKEAKEENSKLQNQKASAEFKLSQVEARLKETLETMEQERAELEGLRAEILVSSHHPQPSKSPHSEEGEPNETATIVNTATAGSVSSEPVMSEGSEFRQAQIEFELKEKQSRIEFLKGELGRYLSLGKPKTSAHVQSNMDSNTDGDAIMDQEKMLVIQKYQRLLLIKDEENLKLMNRLEELEEESENNSKARFNLSPSRGLLFQRMQSSPKSKQLPTTKSLRTVRSFHGRSHVTSMVSPPRSRNSDEIDTAKELAKVTQQLVGLKLITRQSNEERAISEKDNQALKEMVAELKQNCGMLEQKLVHLIQEGDKTVEKPQASPMHQNRVIKYEELGIEMETALADIGNTLHEACENHGNPPGGKVIIGDYKRVKQLEHEIDMLKEKLVNLEQKHSQQVAALQNEVMELENIIEAKVFQEEKLEMEIEDLKQVIGPIKSAHMNASSTPRVGRGSLPSQSKRLSDDKSLNSLPEENEEDVEDLDTNQLLVEGRDESSKVLGVLDSPYQQLSPAADWKNRKSPQMSQLTNANYSSDHHHPSPSQVSPSEICELCDGIDHELASCPIFSGQS